MDASSHIVVPLRAGSGAGGGKKMKKRRELDALIAKNRGRAHSQDKLMSASTDDPDDYNWAKVSGSNHHRIGCRRVKLRRLIWPLLLIGAIFMLVGFVYWLYFDMKQQFDDYRQKIEEVSAASKSFPNTLQNLHETSTTLLRNQTALLLKLDELQHNVDMLRTNFSDYRSTIDAQQNYVKYNKLVADFGAKIEATTMDMERVKEHYNNVVADQKRMELTIRAMQSNFTQYQNQALGANQIPYNNITDELHNLRSSWLADVRALEANLSQFNSSFNQQSDIMRDELAQHKAQLDRIFDRFENVTSHVSSIETMWPDMRQKVTDCKEHTNRLDGDLANLKKMLLLETNYTAAIKEERRMHSSEAANLPTTSTEELWSKPKADLVNAALVASSSSNTNNNIKNNSHADVTAAPPTTIASTATT